jgi:phage N-6-adenine-methyltransferase
VSATHDTEITIDPEFQSFIPPLEALEFAQLEANILADGCRDPLVVWARIKDATNDCYCKDCSRPVTPEIGDGIWKCPTCGYGVAPASEEMILLDGHNRLEICTANGIDYSILELSFSSRDAAMDWMDRNQLGRRNLSPEQTSLLRGRIYNRVKKANGKRGAEKLDQNDQAFKSTNEDLAASFGVSGPTVRRDGQFAEAVEKLDISADIAQKTIDAPKKDIVAAAKALPETPTVEQKREAVEKLKTPHVSNNSGNNEWYTPAEFCESARAVMGSISLDPASCKTANKNVKAEKFFDINSDGLNREWFGNVWLNPPYAQPEMSEFVKKLIAEYQSARVSQAIVLVNNATETSWFQALLMECSSVCLKAGRIKFLDSNGEPAKTPLQGQAFLYFGECKEAFIEEFSKHGRCLV